MDDDVYELNLTESNRNLNSLFGFTPVNTLEDSVESNALVRLSFAKMEATGMVNGYVHTSNNLLVVSTPAHPHACNQSICLQDPLASVKDDPFSLYLEDDTAKDFEYQVCGLHGSSQ